MTSQGTNRREGGSTSCHGCIWKLRSNTYKELETVRAAPELLDEPNIGGGSALPGGGGGGSQRNQKSLPSRPECTKTAKKQPVFHTYWLKKTPKSLFLLKSTLQNILPRRFLRIVILILIFFCFLRHCGVIPVQSFGSHIRIQPPGLGLKLENVSVPDKCLQFLLIFEVSLWSNRT